MIGGRVGRRLKNLRRNEMERMSGEDRARGNRGKERKKRGEIQGKVQERQKGCKSLEVRR